MVSIHNDTIVVASSANSNEAYVYQDKTGNNTFGKTEIIRDNLDSNSNTISRMSANYEINDILLNRQGRYGWPTWKQIRTQEHPIARLHRRQNTFSRVYMGNPQKNKNFNQSALPFDFSGARRLRLDKAREILGVEKDISVFTWIKHPETSHDNSLVIFAANTSAGGNRFIFAIKGHGPDGYTATGSLGFYQSGVGWKKSSYDRVDDNDWHHVGFVYKEVTSTSEVQLYLDGKAQGEPLDF